MRKRPYLLIPAAKEYLWGGTRLNDDFNLNICASPFAEAWMCSTHNDGVSLVSGLDCSLKDLLSDHPEWLGSHVLQTTGNKPELPIIIKLIDAKEDLSIQVHPDDEYALRVEGDRGKTEMWYVLDADPMSALIYGFRDDTTIEEVKEHIAQGNVGNLLNRIRIQKDDLFYIEAGTVHAICAGALIAEIQESSNVTYRLYDYNRVDKNGSKRPLQIEKALEIMKLSKSVSPRQPLRVLKYRAGCASELLVRCNYFQVERLILNTEVQRSLVEFKTDASSFHALLVFDGCGSINWNGGGMNFFKGDCIFIPAESETLKLHGKAQILNVRC